MSHGSIGERTDEVGPSMRNDWRLALAIIGMVLVVPLSGWMFLVGTLASSGVFENQDAKSIEAGGVLALAAAIAGCAAIICLVGFLTRSRLLIGHRRSRRLAGVRCVDVALGRQWVEAGP